MLTKSRYLCLGATLAVCLCAGFGYAWSVLQAPIVALQGWPEGQVSLAFTLTVVCSTLTPLAFSGLIQRLPLRPVIVLGALIYGGGIFATGWATSLWQLYLFYGVCSGLGCGLIYPSMIAYAVRLFPERSGFASGLATAAYGSGAVLWAPVAASLAAGPGLSFTFRALGLSFSLVILAAVPLLRELGGAAAPAEGSGMDAPGLRRGQMVRTGRFYCMVAIFTCGLTAGMMVISQASPMLQQSLGLPAARAAALVSVFSACNMAGRFLWGGLSDRLGSGRTMTCIFSLCILSMALLAAPVGSTTAIVFMALAASCYGGFAAIITPLTAQVFGRRYLTENYGVMYVVYGLASLIGPNLAVGFKSAGGGNYTGAFLTAALLAAAGLAGSLRLMRGGAAHGI